MLEKERIFVKNLAVALLFATFFGPIGLLYATTVGGIIMIVLGFIVVCSKLIVPMILTWLLCCIWAVIATNRHNKKILIK